MSSTVTTTEPERYTPPPGTVDGISVRDHTPDHIRRARARAAALRDSGLLVMMERLAMDDVIARCERLLVMLEDDGAQ